MGRWAVAGLPLRPPHRAVAPPRRPTAAATAPARPPLRPDGTLRTPARRPLATEQSLAGYLRQARDLLAARPDHIDDRPTGLPGDFEALHWFPLPSACLAHAAPPGGNGP